MKQTKEKYIMKKTEKRIVLANAMSSIAKFSIRRSEEHTSELQSRE